MTDDKDRAINYQRITHAEDQIKMHYMSKEKAKLEKAVDFWQCVSLALAIVLGAVITGLHFLG